MRRNDVNYFVVHALGEFGYSYIFIVYTKENLSSEEVISRCNKKSLYESESDYDYSYAFKAKFVAEKRDIEECEKNGDDSIYGEISDEEFKEFETKNLIYNID